MRNSDEMGEWVSTERMYLTLDCFMVVIIRVGGFASGPFILRMRNLGFHIADTCTDRTDPLLYCVLYNHSIL